MRIAELCPNCATYINASCIIYNGDYLANIDIAPLTSLDEVLEAINDAFAAATGTGAPTDVPAFVGQLYIDTSTMDLWVGLSDTIPNWGLIGQISTTTTTTTV
jgi:hypothetical protein